MPINAPAADEHPHQPARAADRTLDAQLNIGYINSELRRPQNDNNSYGVVSGVDARRRGGLRPGRARRCTGPLHGGTDTVSFGYYNRGISPTTSSTSTRARNVQRLTGGLTSNWTPTELVRRERHHRRRHQPSRRHETLPPGRAAVDQDRRRKVIAASTARTSSTTRRA